MTKIQTGLRIPEDLHVEIRLRADKAGVSLNAYILMLISAGLSIINQQRSE